MTKYRIVTAAHGRYRIEMWNGTYWEQCGYDTYFFLWWAKVILKEFERDNRRHREQAEHEPRVVWGPYP